MTLEPAVRYAPLRDGESWPNVRTHGLLLQPDGTLELAGLPGLEPPVYLPFGDPGPSGLAVVGPCDLWVADTEGGRVVHVRLDCDFVEELWDCGPEHRRITRPVALAAGPHDWLLVADRDRVLVFSNGWHLRDVWWIGGAPIGLAVDGESTLVLDAAAPRVLRLSVTGDVDDSFAPTLDGTDPRAIACDGEGVLYVSDARSGSVLRFDREGRPVSPALALNSQPRSLAAAPGGLYVSDRASGRIVLLELSSGEQLGLVPGFYGPATALATSPGGDLFVKTSLDDSYRRASAGASHVATGHLEAGPLDAGKGSAWYRIAVKATAPESSWLRLETFLADTITPGNLEWKPAPALNELVDKLDQKRYLWLRVTLRTDDQSRSPRLTQIEAETPGDSYLDYLPALYSRDPEQADFVTRLLELARSQLGELESAVQQLPRLYEPSVAPAEALLWLASWLAFPVPDGLAMGDRPGELRALLEKLPAMLRRRGTPAGVREQIELRTSRRAHLYEDFRSRGVWMLDSFSALGFDTVLPGEDVDGLIVGKAVVGASGPQDVELWGSALFQDQAHRFTVVLPRTSPREQDLARRVVEEEKPAHTVCHLCFVRPRMRIGMQAAVGVDSLVAGEEPVSPIGEGVRLDVDARLAPPDKDSPGRVGDRGRISVDTRLD